MHNKGGVVRTTNAFFFGVAVAFESDIDDSIRNSHTPQYTDNGDGREGKCGKAAAEHGAATARIGPALFGRAAETYSTF
jgi:hypothetical protein